MKKILCAIVILVVLATALVSCGGAAPTVIRTYVDGNNHVWVEFSDGTKTDAGAFTPSAETGKETSGEPASVSVKSTEVNEALHLIVTFTDGTTEDLGYVGVADPAANVTVTKSYVDEALHAWVEFSDGTKTDLGYVGVEVEVEPPLYTVTFLDADGKEIATVEVYKGKAAKAPEAPKVADATFIGWDKDISAVMENMTVKAQYSAAETFTVTFVDENGATISTQQVISGHAATAPKPPTREDTIFTGWDQDFSRVTANMTVKAQFRAKQNFTVTFKDYSGVALGTAQVKEGDTAKAPVTPTREGYKFTGWSASLNNVTSNKTVTAQYSFSGGANVLDISYSLGSNNTVTVVYAVKGTVKFCGAEGSITVPSGFTYQSHTDGDGATSNYKDGVLYFMYSSNNGKNVTSDTTIVTVTYTVSGSTTSGTFTVEISDMYDQDFANVAHSVIGKTVKVK